jgi:membrane dipeptidase
LDRTPAEIDTVADLQKLDSVLRARGYSEADVAGILGQNWVALLRRGLPG